MSIYVNTGSKVLVQGITGREGSYHTAEMVRYGTNIVAGVVPGKGGQVADGNVPVFDLVSDAVEATGADVSIIFVPAAFATDAILEAADSGVRLIVAITDGIPLQDAIRLRPIVRRRGAILIGPNCPGVITPGECKVGIMPGEAFTPGPVGVVSRSGTLTYEIVDSLTRAGLGQSTCVGIGGDPVPGTTFVEVLRLFEDDNATKAVVMVGEIGGSDEEAAAEFITTMTKPVIGFIGGRSAPPGKRMGHAGAIVSGSSGGAEAKVHALREVGAAVADATDDIPALVARALNG
ncbi:MAG: succinate--CoA ligase subunit alpha [Chthonomonadales bacterium]|nr:succinate--CoA ligase subunit alpha [Chthonomonadales bacterium]